VSLDLSVRLPAETGTPGEFVRGSYPFTERVHTESESEPGEGPDDQGRWPVEPGRYRLVVSLACPWAHRAVIARRLLGLGGAISLAVVDPIRDERGWRFPADPGVFGGVPAPDPVLGITYLAEAYARTDPDFTGRPTVPTIIDTLTGRVVSNDFPQVSLDLSLQWSAHHRAGAPDLYPPPLRAEMDALMWDVYREVNNGVYRCGFATTQAAYDEAFAALFGRLDLLSRRLESRRYLMGKAITEADIRLFVTLVRFDAVYHGHFKCNQTKLSEMPVLWAYARDLYQTPGFGETVDLAHITHHYYGTHPMLNPSRIVPGGPDPAGWLEPSGR
jgi:putative glutathione S-transferase